ncbi:12298_t:CDS:1 [Funneliformis caledonium]|uniref:12298_t:CDS:1 n=1 Tax=Funneliformis caledonium TaxID=1117310 RepID=A0A9N9EFA3_9GLOM|nr:12298_t:CDS:1 [Funneliformis caledonium]
MELDTLYSCGSNGYNEALFSDTFNFFNENFDDISLYHNFLTNDVNFLPDLNFLPDSEPLSLNSNIQHLEPLNDIPDSDIPTFELLNDISNPFNYQYNLAVGDSFDDWLSVDAFMHQYCFERGFGYQIFRSDKDLKDPTIIHHKSFRCSSSGVYKA